MPAPQRPARWRSCSGGQAGCAGQSHMAAGGLPLLMSPHSASSLPASNLPLVHCPSPFSAVESEVAAQQGGALHTLVADECQRKAAAEAAALASAVALDSTAFLQHVVNLWEAYSSQLSLIRCAAANEGAWLFLHRVCLALGVSAAAGASGVVTPVPVQAGVPLPGPRLRGQPPRHAQRFSDRAAPAALSAGGAAACEHGHCARLMTCGRRLGPLDVGSWAAWCTRVVLKGLPKVLLAAWPPQNTCFGASRPHSHAAGAPPHRGEPVAAVGGRAQRGGSEPLPAEAGSGHAEQLAAV